jgi:hypothetical protein
MTKQQKVEKAKAFVSYADVATKVAKAVEIKAKKAA